MKNVFDKFSDGYDDWYSTKMGAFIDQLESEAALALLKPEKRQRILDVGCGTGNFSIKLAKLGCDVTGIDISEKMLDIARSNAEKTGVSIDFRHMDVSNIQLQSAVFDGVISMAAFEFVENPLDAYSCMLSVLKTNGIMVIGTIQEGSLWQELYCSDVFKDSAYAFARFKSKQDLISLDDGNFDASVECLFIPPGLEESQYTLENETKYKSLTKLGGFLCVSFSKRA